MKADTVLDYAVFELSPKYSRLVNSVSVCSVAIDHACMFGLSCIFVLQMRAVCIE